MNYSKEEFFNLLEETESQGAEHLDEVCAKHQTYEFEGRAKPVVLRGCGNSTLFHVPYEGGGVAKVCAVDDDMGRWPRFGGDRFGREETSA